MKFYKYPVILFAIVFLSGVCFSEEAVPSKPVGEVPYPECDNRLEATAIVELYAKSIVDVSTIIRY